MIDHRRFLILAAGAIDFDLTPSEGTELDEHLTSCADCRRISHRFREQAVLLRDRARPTVPPRARERLEVDRHPTVFRGRTTGARLLLLIGAAVMIGALGLTLVGGRSHRSDEPVPSPTLTPSPPTAEIRAVGDIRAFQGLTGAVAPVCDAVGGSDCVTDTLAAAGSLWITTRDSVLRFDPVEGKVLATIPVGTLPHRLWFDGSSVWTSVQDPGGLVRIDPRTNQPGDAIVLGGSPVGIVDTAGGVWVVDQVGDRVLRVDPSTNQVVASIPLELHPWAITATDGALWVTDRSAATLLRIDPVSDLVVGEIDVSAGRGSEGTPGGLAVGFGRVWLTGQTSLKSYDLLTGLVKTYPSQNDPRVAIAADAVWITGDSNFLIQRLDPVSGAVTGQTVLPIVGDPTVAHFEATVTVDGDGIVWVGTNQGDELLRVTPTP